VNLEGSMPSDRQLEFAILEYLKARGCRHKINTIGRSIQPGDLELKLGIRFDSQQRARAAQAWDRLANRDLIRSDYGSLTDPEQWMDITEAGTAALARHALDDLDEVLHHIEPGLVDKRDAAWAVLDQAGAAAVGQAASSMCEVIDQLLHALAPEARVRAMPGFTPDPSARTGITRRHRARLVMQERLGGIDENRCAAVVAAADELQGLKHSRDVHVREDGLHALQFAEEVLRRLLLTPLSAPAATASAGNAQP
jgi:hypothetical protein